MRTFTVTADCVDRPAPRDFIRTVTAAVRLGGASILVADVKRDDVDMPAKIDKVSKWVHTWLKVRIPVRPAGGKE